MKVCTRCDSTIAHKHGGDLCSSCVADEMIDFEDLDPYEDDGLDDCGMMPDGGCMLAGTEFCDWDCPLTYSSIRSSAAPEPGA